MAAMTTRVFFMAKNRESLDELVTVETNLPAVPEKGSLIEVPRLAPTKYPWDATSIAGSVYMDLLRVDAVALGDPAGGAAITIFGEALPDSCGSVVLHHLGGAVKAGLVVPDEHHQSESVFASLGRVLRAATPQDRHTAMSDLLQMVSEVTVGDEREAGAKAREVVMKVIGRGGVKEMQKGQR